MDFVAIDLETANADMSSICQIGIARYEQGELVEEWESLVNPESYFDDVNISIHGITETMVADAPTLPLLADKIDSLMAGKVCVCHTHYDRTALMRGYQRYDLLQPGLVWLDSAKVARRTWDQFAKKGYGLKSVCKTLGYTFKHHDALEDAKAAGFILLAASQEAGLSLNEWLDRVRMPILPGASGTASQTNQDVVNDDFDGEVVVFTGALSLPRREAAEMAVKAGCVVKDGVTKNTTVVVVGDQDVARLNGHDKSSKHRRAEDLMSQGQPIRIMMESDFRRMVEAS